MLLAEIRQQIVKYPMGKGIVTDENQINYGQLNADIISGAAALKATKLMSKDPFLSSVNYLTTTIEYNLSIQQDPTKYRDFQVPLAILGRYNYVGSDDFDGNISVVNSVAEYSDSIKCQIPSRVRAFIARQGILRIQDAFPENIVLNFIPQNPMDCKDWNPMYDEFPLDEGLTTMLISTLADSFYKYINGQPIDTKPDSVETNTKNS
jgi:hypothetical protein